MSQCPYCGVTVDTPLEENRHMNTEHPEVIAQRMIDAGFRLDEDGQWVDLLVNDD